MHAHVEETIKSECLNMIFQDGITNRNAINTIAGATSVLINAARVAVSIIVSSRSDNSDIPNHTGVPMAPKMTGMVLVTKQNRATFTGAKPKLKSMGAAIAAGVPKPLAPSIRNANAQPTIIN